MLRERFSKNRVVETFTLTPDAHRVPKSADRKMSPEDEKKYQKNGFAGFTRKYAPRFSVDTISELLSSTGENNNLTENFVHAVSVLDRKGADDASYSLLMLMYGQQYAEEASRIPDEAHLRGMMGEMGLGKTSEERFRIAQEWVTASDAYTPEEKERMFAFLTELAHVETETQTPPQSDSTERAQPFPAAAD